MSDQAIIDTVDPIAAGQGVPSFIWEVVAETESSMNPRAMAHEGDGSYSYGLFQLNSRGQLGNLTPEQAYDPATNARAAMPAIAKTWKSLSKGVGAPDLTTPEGNAGSYNWWYLFAVQSGHPGADPVAAANEAHKLQDEAIYLSSHPLPKSSSGNNNQTKRNPPDTSPVDCSLLNPGTYGACIDNYIYQSFVSPVLDASVKIGIFILALVIIVAGLWAVTRSNTGGEQ